MLRPLFAIAAMLVSGCASTVELESEAFDEAIEPEVTLALCAQPLVHETFARSTEEWPAAWRAIDAGDSWVRDHAGFMQPPAGREHGRALFVPFADIDVAVRFGAGEGQRFELELRGDGELATGARVETATEPGAATWLRVRIWDDAEGVTHVESKQWRTDQPQPEGWRAAVAHGLPPVGTLALRAAALGEGAAEPLRIDEVVVCPVE